MTICFPKVQFRQDESRRAIAEDAQIGTHVHLGIGVVVYPKVRVGDRSVIMDGAVLGRIPLANKTVTRPVESTFSDLIIGSEAIIGCHTVLYTGSTLGHDVLIGDLTSIREGCVIGDGVVIGRGVMALYECTIGNFTRIQDQVHLVGKMTIEDHVFIGMQVTTVNDNEVYRSRFGLVSPKFEGPVIRRYAVVGAGATILAGVQIGEGSMVAAGSVVTHDVLPWTVVSGVPARQVREISSDWRRQIESLPRD